MVSIAFINGGSEPVYSSDQNYSIVKECNEITESIMDAIHDYESSVEEYKFESSLTGEMDEDELVALEAKGDNIFKKIGDGVISLIKKLIKMVQGFVDKLKGNSFAKKSDLDKIEIMCKKHPELKEQIIANASAFEFNQIKTIADMEENYNKIMKMEDESKRKKAIEKFKKGAATTVGVAASAVTVIKFGEAIIRLKDAHKRMTVECQSVLDKKIERANKLESEINKLELEARKRAREEQDPKDSNYKNHNDLNDNERNTWLNNREQSLYNRMRDELDLLTFQINELNGQFRDFTSQSNNIFGKIRQVMRGFNQSARPQNNQNP